MNNCEDINKFRINTTDYFINEDNDDIVRQIAEAYNELITNKECFDLQNYTYFSNTDDDKIPNLMISETAQEINQYIVETNTHNQNGYKYITVNSYNTPSDNCKIFKTCYSSDWSVIEVISKIKRGINAATYFSIQKKDNELYVVITKTSNKYNPKEFALPFSSAQFISECISEAYKNKDKNFTTTPTSRNNWLLCKEYGSIYTHPKNRIAVSHQQSKGIDYIVLTKYDKSNKPKNFAFSITYAEETSNALSKAYTKYNGELTKKFVSIRTSTKSISAFPSDYKSKVMRCTCGHLPKIYEVHINFLDITCLTYSNCYCPNCRIHAKSSVNGENKFFFYWNQMIRTLLHRKPSRFSRN